MACTCKQGEEEEEEEGGEEDELLESGTHLLQLDDDAHGVIFSRLCLDNPPAARAFRQSCTTLYRSTSINARVLASTIPIPTSAPNPGACVEALAAFPKHATLRFLRLLGQGAGLVDSSLLTSLHALQLDQPLGEEGAEALRRSQTVEKVSLKKFNISASCAGALLGLFPKLHDAASPVGRLMLEECPLDDGFVSELGHAGAHITNLALIYCSLKARDWGASLCGVAALRCLRVLYVKLLWNVANQEVGVDALCTLQQLQQLTLGCCRPTGLPELLQAVPLRKLVLLRGTLLPLGMRYASGTLQELELEALSLDLPKLRAVDMPALQRCSFNGIWLGKVFGGVPASTQQQVKELVAWAGALPLQGVDWGPQWDVQKEEAWGDLSYARAFDLRLEPNWPAETCSHVLEALVPLQWALEGLRRLRVQECNMRCCATWAVLHSLFHGLRRLDLLHVQLDEARSLQSMIEGLPFLECLDVSVPDTVSLELPHDVEAVMRTCLLGNRPFKLLLDMNLVNDDACISDMSKVRERWSQDGPQDRPPGSCPVQLEVTGLERGMAHFCLARALLYSPDVTMGSQV